jgi:hypothetical protein
MAKTTQFELPLVAPAQAQKHVTVNEALARLDAVAQLRVASSSVETPPSTITDGKSFLVPVGATGDWSGRAGQIAVGANGGWVFLTPKAGWLAWDESSGSRRLFDGVGWVADAVVASSHGAVTTLRAIEFEHTVVAGQTNLTSVLIPSHSQVVGVTARVILAMSGTGLSGWRVGVSGSDARYGSGLGTALNAYLLGLSGSPVTYYAPTPLLLTAEGGTFIAGTIRFALHILQIAPPRPV